jgi:hypothetical protein
LASAMTCRTASSLVMSAWQKMAERGLFPFNSALSFCPSCAHARSTYYIYI